MFCSGCLVVFGLSCFVPFCSVLFLASETSDTHLKLSVTRNSTVISGVKMRDFFLFSSPPTRPDTARCAPLQHPARRDATQDDQAADELKCHVIDSFKGIMRK